MLNQGIRFEKQCPTATVQLPSAVEKPTQLATGNTDAHQFHCPPDTAGTVKLKPRKSTPAVSTHVVCASTPAMSHSITVCAPTPVTTQSITVLAPAPATNQNFTVILLLHLKPTKSIHHRSYRS